MHIPDGFLDAKTLSVTAALSATGIGMAVYQAQRRMSPRRVPLMGVAAAFVFAAQMLNFPVAGGTSGHLLGAVLASVLLGPSAAVLVMTAVLVVQCFLFADGGVLALGANLFNMAIVGPTAGYAIYRVVRRAFAGERGRLMAVAFASWCSTMLAAVCCAGELAWSGTAAWAVGFTAMANVHMLIGIGEGLISTLVVAAVARTRPDLLDDAPASARPRGHAEVLVYGLVIALGLAIFVSPFASPWPDGLERVAAKLGFEQKALTQPLVPAAIGGYELPGVRSPAAATALAGAVGTVVMFGLAFLLGRLLAPKPGTGPSSLPKRQ